MLFKHYQIATKGTILSKKTTCNGFFDYCFVLLILRS